VPSHAAFAEVAHLAPGALGRPGRLTQQPAVLTITETSSVTLDPVK
jgi:hypothetical protein